MIQKAFALGSDFCKCFVLIRKNEGYTALHIGVHSESNESIKLLVEATKDIIPEFISAIDQHGQTALHWAASKNNRQACEVLCQAMQPEEVAKQTSNRLQTALHYAVQGGDAYLDTISLLLTKLQDRPGLVGLSDENDMNILHWAALRGQNSVVMLLLSKPEIGSQLISACNRKGLTPIELAQGHVNPEVLESMKRCSEIVAPASS